MAYIELTKGKAARIDDDMIAALMGYKWFFSDYGYAKAQFTNRFTKKRGTVLMHRLLMSAVPGEIVDHINGDRLDNRVANLRLVTRAQSNQNKGARKRSISGLKGVYWNASTAKWFVRIEGGGQSKYLGSFADKIEAARVYDKAALELYGEYARLNKV